MTYEHVRCLAA